MKRWRKLQRKKCFENRLNPSSDDDESSSSSSESESEDDDTDTDDMRK